MGSKEATYSCSGESLSPNPAAPLLPAVSPVQFLYFLLVKQILKSPYFTVGQNLGAKPTNQGMAHKTAQQFPAVKKPLGDVTKDQNITDKKPMEYETYNVSHLMSCCSAAVCS